MAELNGHAHPFTPPPRWTQQQTAGQFRAIAWLRWRMLVNGFRRKGGTGELVARILVYPILAALTLVPTVGAGVMAWYFTHNHELAHVNWLLWIAFVLGQLLSINLSRPGTTFNPNELIRFPLALRRFIVVRLFFGTLSPANVVVICMSFAIALGVTVADPGLWIYALLSLGLFAATNVLFTRMVFAWVDRWLSTRRAREMFTLLIFALSIGFQWANINFNPAYNHGAHRLAHTRLVAVVHLFQKIHPLLIVLPPELSTYALLAANRNHGLVFLLCLLGTGLFAAAFLAVFALRMRTEYRGEALTDLAIGVSTPQPRAPKAVVDPEVFAFPGEEQMNSQWRTIWTIMCKEMLYIRRNTGLFYSLIVPILMVFLFATRISMRSTAFWILPGAVAYSLLGVMPLTFNLFGLESTGIQFYFLAPIRLRNIFIAKNLMNVALAAAEIVAIVVLLWYLRGPQPFEIALLCTLWAAATLLVGMTVGNMRSVSAPMRIEFTRAASKQASPVNAFLSMGVLLGFTAIGWLLLLLSAFFHFAWALIPIFAALMLGALVVYLLGLRRIEQYTMDRREGLYAVLAKY